MQPCGLLETVARDLLEAELQDEAKAGGAFDRRAEWTLGDHGVDQCQLHWLLPDLVRMVAAAPTRPVAKLAPIIRQRLDELYFVDETGDSVVDAEGRNQIDVQVEILVRVLEQVRQVAVAGGGWSAAPVAPQMFG